MALQDLLVNITFLVIIAIANSMGTIPSAGVGVAEKLCAFVMLVPSAYMQSMSAFVAQNIGAGLETRARRALLYGVLSSLMAGLLMGWAAFFHGDVLAGIFADDPAVIAGQGTIGLEILEQNPYIESIVVPVGGGGLLAGIAAAVKQVNPKVKVYGVQTEQAPAMYLSKKENKWVTHGVGKTIADGIAVGIPGKLTWKLINQYVDDMLLVNEEDICAAMLLMLERGKMVVEGAGAAPLAALLHHIVPGSDRAAAVISGGNIDVNTISQIIERGLVRTGRRVKMVTWMVDRPGELLKFVSYLEEMKINILYINHDRADRSVPLGVTRVELDVETRNAQHAKEVADTLRKAGYKIEMR